MMMEAVARYRAVLSYLFVQPHVMLLFFNRKSSVLLHVVTGFYAAKTGSL